MAQTCCKMLQQGKTAAGTPGCTHLSDHSSHYAKTSRKKKKKAGLVFIANKHSQTKNRKCGYWTMVLFVSMG